jgi:hypothetical protein
VLKALVLQKKNHILINKVLWYFGTVSYTGDILQFVLELKQINWNNRMQYKMLYKKFNE